MQVSHMDELDSHAVIGGAKALAFGISDSPEFFTILSKTLYRDEKLAVVRETVCNADDAHKMVNKTSVAIEITLTDEELIIKDFGPGIPDEKMQPIYCVYGNSTKVKDDKATGGFGLGCKAPFAYSDHFTVTSCNGSFKSVYALSRGGMETDGKPSLIRMVKAPTTETGITVSIPLKDRKDRIEFDRLVRRVVLQGGILARFNGQILTRYDMAGLEKSGYAVASANELTESPVYVRYGAVLYPVTTENPKITKLVNEFRCNGYMTMVIQAPPGSVGVTPSREALSYSEQTIITLKELLANTKKSIQADVNSVVKTFCKREVDTTKNAQIPLTLRNMQLLRPAFATDRKEVAMQVVRNAIEHGVLPAFNVPSSRIAKELMLAASRKYRDHRRYFRRMAHASVRKGIRNAIELYGPDHGRIFRRMALKLDLKGNILAWGPHPEGRYGRMANGRTRYRDDGLYNFDLKRSFTEQPLVVICRGKDQALTHLVSAPYGEKQRTLFITVRYFKPHQLDALTAALAAYKIEHKTLDLAPPTPKPKKPKVVKPKQTFFRIDHIGGSENPYLANQKAELVEAAPLFIDMQTTMTDTEQYKYEVREILKQRKALRKAYPNIALAYGQMQKKALIAAGSRPLVEVLAEDILALKDTPAVLFAANCAEGDITSSGGSRSATAIACELAETDMRFAKLLTRQKVSVSPEELKAHVLFQVSAKIPFGDGGAARKHALELKRKALKLQRKREEFAYLKPLEKIWDYRGHDETIEFTEELMEMIRFLQKRFDKTAKTTIQLKTEPMKEAA